MRLLLALGGYADKLISPFVVVFFHPSAGNPWLLYDTRLMDATTHGYAVPRRNCSLDDHRPFNVHSVADICRCQLFCCRSWSSLELDLYPVHAHATPWETIWPSTLVALLSCRHGRDHVCCLSPSLREHPIFDQLLQCVVIKDIILELLQPTDLGALPFPSFRR